MRMIWQSPRESHPYLNLILLFIRNSVGAVTLYCAMSDQNGVLLNLIVLFSRNSVGTVTLYYAMSMSDQNEVLLNLTCLFSRSITGTVTLFVYTTCNGFHIVFHVFFKHAALRWFNEFRSRFDRRLCQPRRVAAWANESEVFVHVAFVNKRFAMRSTVVREWLR